MDGTLSATASLLVQVFALRPNLKALSRLSSSTYRSAWILIPVNDHFYFIFLTTRQGLTRLAKRVEFSAFRHFFKTNVDQSVDFLGRPRTKLKKGLRKIFAGGELFHVVNH